jgi:manganese/zinc/iron transport system ATP- binding protein
MFLNYSGRTHVDSVPDSPAIEIHDLHVRYDANQGEALSGVSVTIPASARVALIGQNGAGKSTLLKTLVGLQPYSSGSVLIFGRNVRACHHRVAYLPQRGEIDWRFPISVRRFVLTGRYVHIGWLRQPNAHDYALVEQTLERLNLASVADRLISDLSGGQQQRALLGRAIVQESELLLLDEPFNNIDPETRLLITRIVAELKAFGRTIVVATHDLSRLREEFDYVAVIHDGTIAAFTDASSYAEAPAELAQ